MQHLARLGDPGRCRASTDTGQVELGVKFTAEVDGQIAGVRFYKGPRNVGTHTGSLWTAPATCSRT